MDTSVDQLFLDPSFPDSEFQFDARVAAVFDNMINRSIPFYKELQLAILELAKRYAKPHTAVYDLGCSTGTTLSLLTLGLSIPSLRFIGIDASASMIEQARKKVHETTELIVHDLTCPYPFLPSSVMIVNLVLQFLPKSERAPLLSRLYDALIPGGVLILIEKTIPDSDDLTLLYQDIYHQFKQKNGYSELEISRKKAALTTTLIPHTPSQNRDSLRSAGFVCVEPFFNWFNFMGILSVK